jgi:hypothetical protein
MSPPQTWWLDTRNSVVRQPKAVRRGEFYYDYHAVKTGKLEQICNAGIPTTNRRRY